MSLHCPLALDPQFRKLGMPDTLEYTGTRLTTVSSIIFVRWLDYRRFSSSYVERVVRY